MFFWENNLYNRKESSLTKYYGIRSKLTIFVKLFTFPLTKTIQTTG